MYGEYNKCGPGNKLRTYKLIKKDFGLEKYLVLVTNPRHRTSLARLRLSSHQLEIEMGRHARPPLEANLRTGKACHRKQMDDEIHLVTACTSNATLRDPLFSETESYVRGFTDMTNESKFITLLTTNDKHLINKVAKFVHDSFTLRKSADASNTIT